MDQANGTFHAEWFQVPVSFWMYIADVCDLYSTLKDWVASVPYVEADLKREIVCRIKSDRKRCGEMGCISGCI